MTHSIQRRSTCPFPITLKRSRWSRPVFRVGVPRSPFFETLDPDVAKAAETAIGVLRNITKSVSDVPKLPETGFMFPVLGTEAYAYHATWIAKSPDLYQPVTRDRIIQFAAGVKASDYAQALRQTNLLRREIVKVFSSVDLLITPTMHGPAETLTESKNFDSAGGLRNTSPFDLFGLPTISVPCGFTTSGLPIGLQISGAPWSESSVLTLAHAYERETKWHRRRPKLGPA